MGLDTSSSSSQLNTNNVMSEFESDELVPPIWLDEAFLHKIITKSENDDSIKIKELNFTPGTAKGDHYASVMYRATIKFDSDKSKGSCKSMIIKTMPEEDGLKKDLFEGSTLFETEIGMYSESLPKFERELRKIGDKTVLASKVLYYSLKPRKCIIFEDLVPLGYETIRRRLADTTESKAAFLKLARWHAVSYKLAAQGDKSVTDYRQTFFKKENLDKMPSMQSGLNFFIDILNEHEELKQFVPKFKLVKDELTNKIIESFNSYGEKDAEGIFVLCHADFHSRNMMFKRNKKNQLEDVMLIDFQACYFGSVAMDILYGIYLLLDEDTRRNHREEIIYDYCSKFIETLKQMGFHGKCPTVADFYIELIRHRHWELYLFTLYLPWSYGFCSDGLDIGELLVSADALKKLYQIPGYIEEVKRSMPILMHKGYLEKE